MFGQPVVSAAEGAVVDRSGGGRGGVTTDGQIGRTAGTVASPQLLAGASAAPEIVLSSMGPTKVSPAAGVVLVPPVPNPNSGWTLQSLAKCLLPDGAGTPRRRFRLPIRRSPQIAPIGGRGRSSPSLLRSGPIVASFEVGAARVGGGEPRPPRGRVRTRVRESRPHIFSTVHNCALYRLLASEAAVPPGVKACRRAESQSFVWRHASTNARRAPGSILPRRRAVPSRVSAARRSNLARSRSGRAPSRRGTPLEGLCSRRHGRSAEGRDLLVAAVAMATLRRTPFSTADPKDAADRRTRPIVIVGFEIGGRRRF